MAIDGRNYLYSSVGEGAPQGDPDKIARDPMFLGGSILRIDPFTLNGDDPDCGNGSYGIPTENNINKPDEYCGEILFSGLRHAWRFTLDGGNVIIADVGLSTYEEVNITPLDGYVDFGWSCFEGRVERFECDTENVTMPVHVYEHFQDGLPLCAILGAEQYGGQILFADNCANSIFKIEDSTITEIFKFAEGNLSPTAFERINGKLYITTLDGIVFEWVY